MLNFSDKFHRAHAREASSSLFDKEDSEGKFDLSEDRLQSFLDSRKARTNGFDLSTVEVPVNLSQPLANMLNCIENHGMSSRTHLRDLVVSLQDSHPGQHGMITSCATH